VVSNDSVLVIMHDLTLDETTDVADHPEFADKKTTRVVNGNLRTGYFVSDFTFTELQTLRLKQRLESVGRTDLYDGYFKIPMFADALNFAQQYYDETGKLIGVYIELKSPSYHRAHGWDMEQMVLDQLSASGE
jgi:glycerophosphoryl diester phosphodiesterase